MLPANGPILVTICSRERDTCQKQLLTADRRWGGCFVVAWSWARCRAHRNANCVPGVEEGSERTLVLTFHTGRVLTTSCLPEYGFQSVATFMGRRDSRIPCGEGEIPE